MTILLSKQSYVNKCSQQGIHTKKTIDGLLLFSWTKEILHPPAYRHNTGVYFFVGGFKIS
jgi:hypothetical protein